MVKKMTRVKGPRGSFKTPANSEKVSAAKAVRDGKRAIKELKKGEATPEHEKVLSLKVKMEKANALNHLGKNWRGMQYGGTRKTTEEKIERAAVATQRVAEQIKRRAFGKFGPLGEGAGEPDAQFHDMIAKFGTILTSKEQILARNVVNPFFDVGVYFHTSKKKYYSVTVDEIKNKVIIKNVENAKERVTEEKFIEDREYVFVYYLTGNFTNMEPGMQVFSRKNFRHKYYINPISSSKVNLINDKGRVVKTGLPISELQKDYYLRLFNHTTNVKALETVESDDYDTWGDSWFNEFAKDWNDWESNEAKRKALEAKLRQEEYDRNHPVKTWLRNLFSKKKSEEEKPAENIVIPVEDYRKLLKAIETVANAKD